MPREGVFKACDHVGSDYSAVFEDDGKTAYGYLLQNGEIVGKVWLYNCFPAPEIPDWEDKRNAPYLNPKEFVKDENFPRIENEDEVEFSWYTDANTGKNAVEIVLRGLPFAQIEPSSVSGWSRLAKKDGPLARRLVL